MSSASPKDLETALSVITGYFRTLTSEQVEDVRHLQGLHQAVTQEQLDLHTKSTMLEGQLETAKGFIRALLGNLPEQVFEKDSELPDKQTLEAFLGETIGAKEPLQLDPPPRYDELDETSEDVEK